MSGNNNKVFFAGWMTAAAAAHVKAILEETGVEIAMEGNVMTIEKGSEEVKNVTDALADMSIVNNSLVNNNNNADTSGSETEYEESDEDGDEDGGDVPTEMTKEFRNDDSVDDDDFIDSQDVLF